MQSAASQPGEVLSSAPEQPGKSHSKSHGKSMSIQLLCCVATFCTKKLTCFKLLKGLLSRPGLVFCSKFCQFLFQWSCGHSFRIPLEVCSLSNYFPISGSNTCRPATPWPSSATLSDLRARNVRDYTSRPLEPRRVSWVGDSAIGESTRLPCRRKVSCSKSIVLYFDILYSSIVIYCKLM